MPWGGSSRLTSPGFAWNVALIELTAGPPDTDQREGTGSGGMISFLLSGSPAYEWSARIIVDRAVAQRISNDFMGFPPGFETQYLLLKTCGDLKPGLRICQCFYPVLTLVMSSEISLEIGNGA